MFRSFKALAVIFLAITFLVRAASASISCKNDDNEEVSWFFIYKLPRRKPYSGTEYVYVDSKSTSKKSETEYWKLSSKKINESDSALFNTIADLMTETKRKNLAYALYNDQAKIDDETYKPSESGHTKGLFMFDKKKGVWLIHSVPFFPLINNGNYEYPHTGKRFGQTFLCVTFSYNQLTKIAQLLRHQNPFIYDKADPEKWKEPRSLNLLLRDQFIQGDKVIKHRLWTAAQVYTSYAKPGDFHADVYLKEVAPGLKSNLLVSTWRRCTDENFLPSEFERTFGVENVENLKFHLYKKGVVEVSNTVDHSKWAISKDWDTGHVCVGTLNRVKTQFERGGETLCFKNHRLHRLLRATVAAYEPYEPGPNTRRRTEINTNREWQVFMNEEKKEEDRIRKTRPPIQWAEDENSNAGKEGMEKTRRRTEWAEEKNTLYEEEYFDGSDDC